MHSLKLSVILLSAFVASTLAAGEWGYEYGPGGNGPDKYWAASYADCAGQRQSPINVDTTRTLFDPALGDLHMTNYDEVPEGVTYTLLNKGYGVQVTLGDSNIKLSGGDLGGDYTLLQFHLHWGSNDYQGSEHTINGNKYAAEVHFVHKNDKYETVDEALTKGDGLAVLGYMIEFAYEDNEEWKEIIDNLKDVTNKDETKDLTPFALTSIMPEDTDSYYRYLGSLTTPGCAEVVVWTLLAEPVYLHRDQVAELRTLFADAAAGDNESGRPHIGDNYRPPLPLMGRKVTTSVFASGASSVSVGIITLFCLALALFMKH